MIPLRSDLSHHLLRPPMVRPPTGRPKKQRYKAGKGKKQSCGLCGKPGHKQGTCRMGHDGEGKMIEVAMMDKLRAGVKNKIEIGLPGESCPPLPAR